MYYQSYPSVFFGKFQQWVETQQAAVDYFTHFEGTNEYPNCETNSEFTPEDSP